MAAKSLASQQLAALIARRKLTFTDVAAKIGVTRQSIHYYIEGVNQPGRETMIRLRDEYGIKADAWLEPAQKAG